MADPKPKKATPLSEEQLIQKEAELTARENQLKADIAEFEDFQETVHKIKEANDARDIAFSAEKEEFEAKVAQFESDKAAFELEKLSLITGTEEKTIEISEPVEFDFEGESFQFSDDAPRNILLNGDAYTQEQIAENEDLQLQLIGGNSSLIQKKK